MLATTATFFPSLQDLLDRHADRCRLFRPLLAQRRSTRLPHFRDPMLDPTAQIFELMEVEARDVDGWFANPVLRALHVFLLHQTAARAAPLAAASAPMRI